MRKVCAITGNRADWSRIESILRAIQKRDDLTLQLVVMGGHLRDRSGRTVDEIKKKGFTVDREVETDVPGGTPETMTRSVGVAIDKLAQVIKELSPDIIIVPTDRFETLAIGVAGALMNVHLAHIQGGEVTGTIDESIRHALTKFSHLHFVSTEQSAERVKKMGEHPDFIFNVGCPATDLLLLAPSEASKDTLSTLKNLKPEFPIDIEKPYLLLVQHPVTTEFGEENAHIQETLNAIKNIDMQVIALLPNIDAGSAGVMEAIHAFNDQKQDFHLFSHIPTDIFINVMRNASVMVGNSSSGIREACYFGTPVVNIGSRQSGRERGRNVTDAPNNSKDIEAAIRKQLMEGRFEIEHVYGDGTAGEKTAEILALVKLPPVQKRITY